MSLLLLEYQKKTLIIQTKVYVIITFRVSEENTYHTDLYVIITFRVSGENSYHTDQSVCHYYF